MKLELTEAQQEAVILKILNRDLKNVQEELNDLKEHYLGMSTTPEDIKLCKKHIKMLKRAINFYSITDEY